MNIVAIDFETANYDPASICSVGTALMHDGCIEAGYSSLIRPEENVSVFYWRNIQIHGIRPQDVVDAPDFRQIYKELLSLFDNALIAAHNARFDMNCLKSACINCGLPVPVLRYFDTVELSRRVFPYLQRHRLNDMCDYLHIELDHHQAASDAYGCLMIIAHVMNLTGIYDPEEMLSACRTRIYTL